MLASLPPDTASDSETGRLLARVHEASFAYFRSETNPANGLVIDSTNPESPASIAATGFLLTGLPVAVERAWMGRDAALVLALAAARFFRDAPQDGAPGGTGHRGFFYHFLTVETGRRAWKSEISTIDTALLLAGLLCAAEFFDADTAAEQELRDAVATINARVEWDWALNGGPGSGPAPGGAGSAETIAMGWTPERGFLRYRWEGYNEALILYALAAGSPTHAVPPSAFEAYTRTYRWRTIYGHAHVYAGPLFIHQFSHLWIDFRGIRDASMRERGIDYFENSRRATLVHREYAARNPHGFAGYGPDAWGITASDGPGPAVRSAGGRTRRFWGYRARGAPYGPDDGTLAPWAAIASLPFAPEVVLPSLRALASSHHPAAGDHGFERTHNPTFAGGREPGWFSAHRYALNEGPVVLAVENYRSGLVWQLMRRCAPLVAGLRANGFTGGWLDEA